jgi:hypothetical protein
MALSRSRACQPPADSGSCVRVDPTRSPTLPGLVAASIPRQAGGSPLRRPPRRV